MRTVLLLVWKEYLHVFRDRAMTLQVIAIPVVQLLVLGFAATFEIRETSVYLVDRDQSPESREVVAHLEASGLFRVTAASASLERADRALLRGEATMILHIPPAFSRTLARGLAAPVQLILDAEQGATAGVVGSRAAGILADLFADRRAAGGPIEVRLQNRYNPMLSSSDYMVPGILVSLVTVIGTLLTAQNIAREKELGTLDQLNVTPVSRTQFIVGKLLPFWLLGLAELALGLGLAHLVFAIPLRGSLLLVFAIAAVFLVAALAVGLLISTVAETQQQAMFVNFFVLMIYLLMSGLFTPLASMPTWAQHAALVNPVRHFVEAMRAVLVKGAGPADVLVPVGALGVLAVGALLLAVRRYSKRSG